MKQLYLIFCLGTSCFIYSCIKDKPPPHIPYDNQGIAEKVILLNEGAFGNNNAEISIIDEQKNITYQQIFKAKNNFTLGDVAQHIIAYKNNYYVSVNNSHTIYRLDSNDFSVINKNNHITYPRYIFPYKDNKLLVTSLYNNYIYIIDASTLNIIDTIKTPYSNTQKLIIKNNEIWVCCWDVSCNKIFIYDYESTLLKDSIQLAGYAPFDIVQDAQENIWILSGNKFKNKNAFLTKVKSENKSIIHSIDFSPSDDPMQLTMNNTKDTLYYINVQYLNAQNNNGIYRMSIYNESLPKQSLINAPLNSYFWALSIHPQSGNIYVSDPKGFTQNSSVYVYNNAGEKLKNYTAGVGCNQFIFQK